MRTEVKKLVIKVGYTIYKVIRTPVKWYWKLCNIETRGVRVMILNQGKVVLVRHWYNSLLVMPGGGVKKHEIPEQAAIREVKEELGIEIKQLDYLLGVYSNKKDGKNDIVYTFVVELSDQINSFRKRFNLEISDIVWVPLHNLLAGTSVATRERIKEYLNKDISRDTRIWS